MSARRKNVGQESVTTESSMILEEENTSFSPELLSSEVPSENL